MKPLLSLGFVTIPTFYLVQSLALFLCLFFLSLRVEANKAFERKTAFDLCILIMISGFLGGRLFHVLYEEPAYYWQYPSQILQFWNGGYVYFGGLILALISSFLFLKYKRESFLHWGDFLAPVLSLMYALGRIGCFFEGCCYGKYCDLPWAVQQRHPTQIYMSLLELLTFWIIVRLPLQEKAGRIFFTWLTLHSLARFVIEFFRDDDRGAVFINLSISQMISLLILGTSFYFLRKNYKLHL